MDPDTIRSIHKYDEWSTRHVLGCCDRVTPEQFTKESDLPWGSVRNQLVHMVIVHKRWLSWADGSLSGEEAYGLRADPDDYPDIESVRRFWEEVNQQNGAFMARLSLEVLQTELAVEQPGFSFSMPTGQILTHIAMHSMQHRTEAAMALTRMGQSPGDIDYLFFLLDEGAVS